MTRSIPVKTCHILEGFTSLQTWLNKSYTAVSTVQITVALIFYGFSTVALSVHSLYNELLSSAPRYIAQAAGVDPLIRYRADKTSDFYHLSLGTALFLESEHARA
jgi:hypothetical protein